jgi:hypothetical protein
MGFTHACSASPMGQGDSETLFPALPLSTRVLSCPCQWVSRVTSASAGPCGSLPVQLNLHCQCSNVTHSTSTTSELEAVFCYQRAAKQLEVLSCVSTSTLKVVQLCGIVYRRMYGTTRVYGVYGVTRVYGILYGIYAVFTVCRKSGNLLLWGDLNRQ